MPCSRLGFLRLNSLLANAHCRRCSFVRLQAALDRRKFCLGKLDFSSERRLLLLHVSEDLGVLRLELLDLGPLKGNQLHDGRLEVGLESALPLDQLVEPNKLASLHLENPGCLIFLLACFIRIVGRCDDN